MGNGQQQDLRSTTSRRFLDPQLSPPAFVDEVLPTDSKVLLSPLKRGRVRAPRGTIAGSLRLTGSYRPLGAPGTYSLRITRQSIFAGSRGISWYIRHSRVGTVDIIHFEAPGQEVRLGDPHAPIYAFGPGTVEWGFLGNYAGSMGSAHYTGQFMEGYLG